jgi:hypothetical protein
MPSLSQTELLSGYAAAGTVRRLWTGTKAQNVNLITEMAMLEKMEQAGGRNERTVALVGKLGYFPPPRLTRR